MNPFVLVLFVGCMFAASVVFSMIGQGGGVMYTPIQVFFGIDFHAAASNSLFLILITSLSSTLVFNKAGKIDWRMAITIESFAATGAFFGGLFSSLLSGRSLSAVFALVVLSSAALMIWRKEKFWKDSAGPFAYFIWHRKINSHEYSINLILSLPIAFLTGALSGMLGLAGGILKIPMMVLIFGIPMDIAVASSAFMVGLTAVGGFAGQLAVGHWDWRTGLLLTLPVFIGSHMGARKSLTRNNTKLKRDFVWLLFIISAFMLAHAIWKG